MGVADISRSLAANYEQPLYKEHIENGNKERPF